MRKRHRSVRPDSGSPFRRIDAIRAGVTPKELLGPRYTRVFHGIYVAAGVRLTPVRRARAAMVVFPSAFASHSTAALIWGGEPPYGDRTHVSVLPGETRSRRRGIAAHLATDEEGVRTKDGIRLSSPERCLCELATDGADLVELVVLGDSLIRAKATTPEELISFADSWPHRRAAVASRAARLVREGVDSSMESRLRMLIVLAGLPEPTVNVIIRHRNGDWKRRFDLCYRELKLLIEYDGEHHVLDSEQRARDLERREELEHQGWRIIVIQKEHIYRAPDRVLERICIAREDCGADRPSCRTRSNWRNYNFAG